MYPADIQRREYFARSTCPACNLLPLEGLRGDVQPDTSTIYLDDLDKEQLLNFAPKCDLCQILVDLHHHWTSEARDQQLPYDGVTYRNVCGRNDWRIRYTDHSYVGLLVEFDGILAKRIDSYTVPSEPLSNHSVRQIKHWIKKCQRKHTKCFDHSKILPTRVIDVRNPTLQLLDPSPTGIHEYVALSHCWGSCRDFLTTRSNLGERKAGFTLEDLPATFKDAVLVTRVLGFRFLWIDSICILQGDKEDWEIEGSKMANVYGNSTLCIAAANAMDDAEGFLKPRSQTMTMKVNIISNTPGSSEAEQKTTVFITPTSDLDYPYAPLDGRAWCLQERYLSPRILDFGWNMARWDCLENSWSETARGLRRSRSMLPDVMPIHVGGTVVHTPWAKLIEHYTERAISFVGDKLPAVSALASYVAEETGDEYLAGLWRSDIIRGLLWWRVLRHSLRQWEPRTPYQIQRSTEYLAPSWSWAAFPGAVNFQAVLGAVQPLPSVKVVDVGVSVPGYNKYGEVESGFLTILSPVLTFKVNDMAPTMSKGSWIDCALYVPSLDDNGFDVLVSSSLDYVEETREGVILGIPLASRCPSDEGETYDHYYDNRSRSNLQPWVKIYGILIVQKEDNVAVYERIGCFVIGPLQIGEFMDHLRYASIQESRIL
ncbi:heterokaryon incompatibility protein-domain-containing protein [Phaeosphaeriaceae sp. PMI808]|nr:heterokaryon incompatibility protein-domain-containing protein [Phaeosphaeriaceae sp. PMI808]